MKKVSRVKLVEVIWSNDLNIVYTRKRNIKDVARKRGITEKELKLEIIEQLQREIESLRRTIND